ncbi:MAG: siroheme synthase [Sphingobacteriaceae bacterium]|nr:siroheme synthase [Sphingobacteriaceae bacterium]
MSIETQNRLFPVFLKLENFRVLIVGGGKVSLEKVMAVLINSPATQLTVVAKEFSNELTEFLKAYSKVTIKQREFENADLDAIDFLIVAINDKQKSIAIKEEAKRRNILANVADTPEFCDFYLGSIVRKGDLKIAISTNGKSPTIAKRVREVFEESFPDEMQEVLENLYKIRTQLNGDFSSKVSELNKLTANLTSKPIEKNSVLKKVRIASLYSLAVIAIMIFGHLVFKYVPFTDISSFIAITTESFDSHLWIYILAGFIAQMIDGALGMAYGVSVTTFLLSLGIPAITPAVASASMHASEVFTTGSSSLVYMRYKNVNMKLFKKLLWPGAIGAILGATAVSFISKDYFTIIKPLVSVYTLVLGVMIIFRAKNIHLKRGPKIKKVGIVAATGGFLDSVGGGGWGPIVTTSLVAGGRNLKYAVGSSHLAKFFVATISTITFFSIIGLNHWQIILGLVIGGMVAAPISIYFSNKIPTKKGLLFVGCLVIAISFKTIISTFI